MKKAKFCSFCLNQINFKGHLTVLALLHLEIERHPRVDFTADEIYEKASVLKQNITPGNIHLNLSYAATQLINFEKAQASKSQ